MPDFPLTPARIAAALLPWALIAAALFTLHLLYRP